MSDPWKMPDIVSIQGTARTVTAELPPHSQEAEDGILGCILISPDPAASMAVCALSIRGPGCFYVDANQILYGALLRMVERRNPIDLITLMNELKGAGELDKIGGIAKLTNLQDCVPSAANLPNYIPIVVGHARRRRVIQEASQLIVAAKSLDSGADSIDVGISSITVAAADRGGAYRDIKALARSVGDRLAERHAAPQPLTLMTGFRHLDYMTGGLEDTDKWCIAARPSMGKTAIGTTILRHVAQKYPERGKAVFLSLEMSAEAITSRLISAEAGLNLKRIKEFREPELRKMLTAHAAIGKSNIIVRDSRGWAMAQLIAEVTAMRALSKLSIVVLDHLGKIEPPQTKRYMDDRAVFAYHSAQITNLNRAAGCPVIVLHQMNREFEKRSGSVPKLSDLAGSGTIEQDMDLISFLYQPKGGEEGRVHEATVDVTMGLAKNRDGETGTVDLEFFRTCGLFADAPVDIGPDSPNLNSSGKQ